LVLEGAPPAAEATEEEIREAVELALGRGLSKKDAAAEVAELFAVARNRVYEIAIAL
jgi:16S rRNA C1402 (ribose-2'-O) methylase RsmI